VAAVAEDGTTPISGVCVTLTGVVPSSVCDGGEGDADPSPGNIEIDGIVAGNYAFSIQAPATYEPVGDVPTTVTIEVGQITPVTLMFRTVASPAASPVTQETGVVIFQVALEDGSALPGVCVQLSGPAEFQACDDEKGDADPTPGSIEIDGVALGDYGLTITPPDGYEAIDAPATIQVPSADLVLVSLTFRAAGTPVPSPEPTVAGQATPEQTATGVVILLGYAEDGTTPFGGFCVSLTGPETLVVCDDQEGDADPTTGSTEIDAVPVGDYALTVTPPDGYEAVAPPSTVQVVASTVVPVTIVFQPAVTPATPEPLPNGVIVVQTYLEDGATPLGGVCIAFTGPAIYTACDNGDRDADPTTGSIEIDQVSPGDYVVSVTPPDGYEAIDPPADLQVPPGDLGNLVLTFRPLATPAAGSPVPTEEATPEQPATGVVVVQVTLEDGETQVGGLCVTLAGSETIAACDDQEGDVDPSPGSIEIDGVPVGIYELTVTPPADYDVVDAPATVDVPAADIAQVVVTLRAVATPPAASPVPTETTAPTEEATPEQPAPGIVVVQVMLEDGVTPLGGACVGLSGPADYSVCDDGDGDVDPTAGSIEIDGVVAGDYTVSIQPPADYELAGEVPATLHVEPGGLASLVVTFRPVATVAPTETATEVPTEVPTEAPTATPTEEPTPQPVPGSLAISKFDAADNATLLPGACFAIAGPDGASHEACDDDNDGVTRFDGLVPGDWSIHETRAPDGYAEGPDQTVTVAEGEEATAVVADEALPPQTGTLVVTKVDAADGSTPLGGACFTVTASEATPTDGTPGEQCDDDGDGTVRFEGLAPGEYTVKETRAPDGYVAAEDQTATVTAGAETDLTFADQAMPQTGTLAAVAVDPNGNALAGSCYVATGPDGAAVDGCDDDGDGRADLGEVVAGDWTVRQTAPPPGHDPADPAEQTVTVAPDQPAEARFGNAPTPPDQLRLPPPLPKPSSVTVVGDFQDELGCPQDNDSTCPVTALTEHHGVWTGVFPIPPGAYTFRIATRNDEERSLGQGGDPNGADLSLMVPAGTAGVYVEYDSATGRIIASPRATLAQVVTEAGSVDLRPIEHGRFEGYFDAPAGTVDYQILLNGQSVTQDQIELNQDSRIHIVVGADGAVVTIETVSPAALTITRTDAGGAAVPGSCFAVLDDRAALVGQACDGDDGAVDGVTTVAFPNGIREGTYTLKETLTPEGANPAPDQSAELHAGDNQIQAEA
jgi:hypothetical protein